MRFELTVQLPVQRFSRPSRSTTPATFHYSVNAYKSTLFLQIHLPFHAFLFVLFHINISFKDILVDNIAGHCEQTLFLVGNFTFEK